MSKKRQNRDEIEKSIRQKNERNESNGDSFGKLLQAYQVQIGGVVLVCGILMCVGAVILAYGFSRRPYSLFMLLTGVGCSAVALTVLIANAMNVGRRLELRKHGIRYVESGITTELMWDEIVEISVDRKDETYLGIASVHKHSSDELSSSGPLTKTDWSVTIHGSDGQCIHLRPSFLRTVRDPRKLLGQLRLRAGK